MALNKLLSRELTHNKEPPKDQLKKKEKREERKEELKNGDIAIDVGATSPRPLFDENLAIRLHIPSLMLGFDIVMANTLFSFAEFFPSCAGFTRDMFNSNVYLGYMFVFQ